MKPKSSTLFHFTKNLETLKSILTNGFWPRYSLEDVRWQADKPNSLEFVAFPVVCFCDIPLSRIDEHVSFYGNFGIGLTREWAVRNKLNPILYVAGENTLTQSLLASSSVALALDGEKGIRLMRLLRHIVGFTKPATGVMTIDGKEVQKDFYQESEWRYQPQHSDVEEFLSAKNFGIPDLLDAANQSSKKYCMLKFSLADIRYLFVRSDTDIPELVNFIQTGLDEHPSLALKVLVSRVTSLQTIREDW